MNEFEYWRVKYDEAICDRATADVRHVMSYGAKISKDGDKFCCLIGENIQTGIAVFSLTLQGAIDLMQRKIWQGDAP